MELSERIRQFRKERDMTQEELAKRLGVTRSTVTQWETGVANPRVGKLEYLAEIFGISLLELMTESPYIKFHTIDDESSSASQSDEGYTDKERELIKMFRSADKRGRKNIMSIARIESKQSGEA